MIRVLLHAPRRLGVACLTLGLGAAGATAQHEPSIVTFDPPAMSTAVDALSTVRLTITFDRDMDTRGHGITGDRLLLPVVDSTQWVDRRTFRMHVVLEPDHIYAFELSRSPETCFRATDGTPMMPRTWYFATAGQELQREVAEDAAQRLFDSIRDLYSRRDARGVDWTRVEREHMPRLRRCRNATGLVVGVIDALSNAQDVGIHVMWGRIALSTYTPARFDNYTLPGLRAALPQLTQVEHVAWMASTEDGIGYLGIRRLDLDRRDLDTLLQALRSLRDSKALVIDVRGCAGGDEFAARRVAGFFVSGERVYAQHRARDASAPDGFTLPEPHSVRGNENSDLFRRRVVALAGPGTRGAAEALLLMLQQSKLVDVIGDKSYGSAGEARLVRLGPGLGIDLPRTVMLRADGSTFDGEGVDPILMVKGEPKDFVEGDPVLTTALSLLRRQH